MAAKLLRSLTRDDLHASVGQPQFEALTAQELGNAGTGTDGFDGMFNDVLTTFAGDASLASSLDQHLRDAGFTPGEFGAGTYVPAVSDYQKFVKAGDGQVNVLGGASTQPQTPASPPPSSGPHTPSVGPFDGGGGNSPPDVKELLDL